MEITVPILDGIQAIRDVRAKLDDDLKVSLVTQLETRFWILGEYTPVTELAQRFEINESRIDELLPKINETLRKRDLPEYRPKIDAAKQAEPDLDPYFVVATSLICDTIDKRSRSVKLQVAGLTSKRFNILLEDKEHNDYYSMRVKKAFGNTSNSAKLALTKNVEAGDLQSIKYYHEFSREFDPNKEIQLNLLQIISQFMEILVKHVDAKVVDTIAKEFETKFLELGS